MGEWCAIGGHVWRIHACTPELCKSPGHVTGESEPLRRIEGDKDWILLVEDDDDTRDALVAFLDEAGYRTKAVASGAAALHVLKTHRPTLILTDYGLGDMDVRELRRKIEAFFGSSTPPLILLTGLPPSKLADVSEVVLQKPVDCDRLLHVVAEYCPS